MLNILLLIVGILTAALGPQTTTTTTSSSEEPPPPGGEPGDPCDPETYDGPYSCVEDPNSDSGYAIAN